MAITILEESLSSGGTIKDGVKGELAIQQIGYQMGQNEVFIIN